MALNTPKCNRLTPLRVKGLTNGRNVQLEVLIADELLYLLQAECILALGNPDTFLSKVLSPLFFFKSAVKCRP